jgi:hypothetical protein
MSPITIAVYLHPRFNRSGDHRENFAAG